MTPPMQIYRQADELLGRERLAHDHGCPDSLERDLERVRNGPSVGGSSDGFENGRRAAARDDRLHE